MDWYKMGRSEIHIAIKVYVNNKFYHEFGYPNSFEIGKFISGICKELKINSTKFINISLYEKKIDDIYTNKIYKNIQLITKVNKLQLFTRKYSHSWEYILYMNEIDENDLIIYYLDYKNDIRKKIYDIIDYNYINQYLQQKRILSDYDVIHILDQNNECYNYRICKPNIFTIDNIKPGGYIIYLEKKITSSFFSFCFQSKNNTSNTMVITTDNVLDDNNNSSNINSVIKINTDVDIKNINNDENIKFIDDKDNSSNDNDTLLNIINIKLNKNRWFPKLFWWRKSKQA